jgi:hypothetical protein
MSRTLRDSDYLEHIQEAMAKIARYVQGVEESGFMADDLLQDGVIRNIEIIGEAVTKLTPELRAKYPEAHRMSGAHGAPYGCPCPLVSQGASRPRLRPYLMAASTRGLGVAGTCMMVFLVRDQRILAHPAEAVTGHREEPQRINATAQKSVLSQVSAV